VKRLSVATLALGVCAAVVGVGTAASVAATGGSPGSTSVKASLHSAGVGVIARGGSPVARDPTGSLGTEIRPEAEFAEPEIPNKSHSGTNSPPGGVPSTAGRAVAGSDALLSVNGLTHADQRLAGTGAYVNTQFSLEPPDQGLCVGGNFVLETVNTALRVKSTSGANLTAPTALNQFFGLAPEIIRSTPLVYGDFVTDPKCYYDAATNRWFLTALQLDVDPSTGAFTGPSHVELGVSQTGDPTGAWNLYSLDVTNDGTGGTPDHPNCPCFGDQPLIGADANAFFISTNEYSVEPFGAFFNGAEIYAIDKAALAAGAASPNAVLFEGGPLEEGISYSVQPATTPPGGTFASVNGGTEYFLSALEFGAPDNRIAVWAVSNTGTVDDATPNLHITHSIVASETYAFPVTSTQMNAPAPLLPLGKRLIHDLYGVPFQPQELIESNDDRMNQVVFAAGKLWSGLNTSLNVGPGNVTAGIAYFIVSPSSGGSATSPTVSGVMAKQGYVGVNKASVIYPSIGVNAIGKGVMTFSLTGNDFWPSSAYVRIDGTNGVSGPVRLAGAGTLPDDGFTGYTPISGGTNVARWGDYSAAVADSAGNVWIASEYIPNLPRTVLANWGTKISKVAP
jgi:hypothetical protein